MAHQVGDIVQVTFRQELMSQVVLNVLHYKVISGTSVATDVGDNASLAQHIAATKVNPGWIFMWSGAMTANWYMRAVRVQKIEPTRSQYVEETVNLSGAVVGDAHFSNVAITITKKGQSGTRRGIGAMHLSGFMAEDFTLGQLNGSPVNWWNTNGHFWKDNITVAVNNITYQPVLYNRGGVPNHQIISQWQQQPTARTMRRRTVGLGI